MERKAHVAKKIEKNNNVRIFVYGKNGGVGMNAKQ